MVSARRHQSCQGRGRTSRSTIESRDLTGEVGFDASTINLYHGDPSPKRSPIPLSMFTRFCSSICFRAFANSRTSSAPRDLA